MFLYFPLITFPLLFKHHGNRLSFYGLKWWALAFRLFSGIRYELRGKEHLQIAQSYVFTPNHTSYLDIPALPLIAQHSFKPLAKKEIGRIPFFGLLAKAVTVMVDRSNAAHRRKSVESLSRALQAGTSLVVFPEGTINKTNTPLAPFYDGAFRIAIETQTPIVPVVIIGASRLMPPRSACMKPGKIRVEILPPLPTTGLGLQDIQALKETVFQKMQNCLLNLQEQINEPDIKKGTATAVPF